MNNNVDQQKIYIDIDEEITTVVEHLRHIRGGNVVLVVPQHAVLLQSVVNLKLLAQEAKKMRKNIIMMTNDADGIAFAQRAGIITQPYVSDENVPHPSQQMSVAAHVDENEAQNMHANGIGRTTKTVGSQSFRGQQRSASMQSSANIHQPSHGEHAAVSGIAAAHGVQNTHTQKMSRPQRLQQPQQLQQQPQMQSQPQRVEAGSGIHAQNELHVQRDINGVHEDLAHYEQSLDEARIAQKQVPQGPPQQHIAVRKDSVLQQKKSFSKKISKKKAHKNKHNGVSHISSGTGLALKSFVFVGVLLIALIALIAVLPKTTVSVVPKHIAISDHMEMTARSDQSAYDADRRMIPARVIERDMTFTKTFSSTGSGDVDAQKAQGTIIIYNEYNDKPQPLVATTRFLSEDGVLFRLVKAATVPGMKDGEPGKVEALVVADKAGSDSNIGPTRFSIPGFDGSPKKGKFYGVSENAMTGGGTGGSGVAIVTKEDIEKAEKAMDVELATYLQEQLNGMLRPDSEVLLPEAITSEVTRSEASVSEGTMGEDFMYEIVSHVKAIALAEEDVLAVVESSVADDMQQYNVDEIEMSLVYEGVNADFDDESLKATVKHSASIVATVDLDAFKEDIIGKKHDDLLSVIETGYGSAIDKITIESVFPGIPAFIADRISRFGFMTDVYISE